MAVGRHHTFYRLLRGTVDVDIDGVAGPQAVGLGGGDVHVGLEGELLVAEQVVAVDFLLLLLHTLQQVLIHRDGVGGQPGVELVYEFQVVLVLIVVGALRYLVVLDAVAGVVAAHVGRDVGYAVGILGIVILCLLVAGAVGARLRVGGEAAQSFFLRHALEFLAYAPYLVDVDTALHELHHNLLL